jgi:hypothetical protein
MNATSIYRNFILSTALTLSGGGICSAATTALTYHVAIDTAPLVNDAPDQPFALLIQLNSGGTPGVTNAVTLSDFSFAGGSGGDAGSVQSMGDVSGDLSTKVMLDTDNSGFNNFSENFSPGSSLSFLLSTTDNSVDPTVNTPDEFSLQILDSAGNPIPTLDPSDADSLITLTYAQPLESATYASDTSRTTTSGASLQFTAPTISLVPEPASAAIVLMPLAYLSRRRSRNL